MRIWKMDICILDKITILRQFTNSFEMCKSNWYKQYKIILMKCIIQSNH